MELRFDGQVAIVTGAARGLGRAYAIELSRRGASVVILDAGGRLDGTDATPDAATSVAAEISAAGGVARAEAASVADPAACRSVVERVMDELGGVHVLINNAGILRDQAFHKLTHDAWASVLAVHLTGTMTMAREVFPHMRAQRYGRIVNTSSAAGLFGSFGQASYGAAKMGIVGLTKVLAVEGAQHGIRVNAVAPVAATRMTAGLTAPLEAVADPRPELVAAVVAYLAHERCLFSGEVLSAGLGRVARVVVGTAPGYFAPDLSAEDVADNIALALSLDGLTLPIDAAAETALYIEHYRSSSPSEQ